MDYLEIYGGAKLSGAVDISGSKNAALPLLALSILSRGDFHITNLPNVADINTFCNLLVMLGSDVKNVDFIESKHVESKNIDSKKHTKNIESKDKDSNHKKDSIESKDSKSATKRKDSKNIDVSLSLNMTKGNIESNMTRENIESNSTDSKKTHKDSKNPHEKIINTQNINSTKAIYDIVRKMRASILVLGPLLTRFGKCEVSLPGGCAIGARPVDLHIKAMQQLGAHVQVKGGYIHAEAKKGLKGCDIVFDKITVTGTSNVVMAAALASGQTRIINAAKEPEVVQVCEELKRAGLDISGIGSPEIRIYGTGGELLDFPTIRVIPDRIEAGTYLCAGAITNSSIEVRGVILEHIESILQKLQEIGFGVEILATKDSKNAENIRLLSAKKMKAFRITTTEYPGFPTDMQAQFMALSTRCEGSSFIKETLFENRFMHASELQRLGANITIDSNVAQIVGPTQLIGADVMATDLRASSALILAALVAKGVTKIHRIYHLDRGYESIESKLTNLGAKIKRGKE
ncbi:UDP-N-acetylglucosamine 1-carboxyvinyltransferase [Helicobacter saguini]|nr:UDP-N-acetylglucosamine 1-carboxyvinyltransferase [Helicobacter saguini]